MNDTVLGTGCSKTMTLCCRRSYYRERQSLYTVHMGTMCSTLLQMSTWSSTSCEAAVSKSLPVSVLLGTDVLELARFVGGNTHGARRQGHEAWVVVT